uniref:Uncharacterized protein n=1 Tax=Rhizochromulina marina TaxID=1034831 RepID=A0A7S2WUC5_9STRA|mmetsp:Transcript_6042/g.17636  ORF Transcript_6042/g.17636 Transcript_6042/m.17636 type:complete len:264 (+) Transcript_6042:32-823(+)
MDGFTAALAARVGASLDREGGQNSLMQLHLQRLQRQKEQEEEEARQRAALAEQEDRRREKERKAHRKDKKKKKKHKKKRKKERSRRSQSSSSGSDSEDAAQGKPSGSGKREREEDRLIREALLLEKQKLEDLRQREAAKKQRSAAKKRRREEEEAERQRLEKRMQDQRRLQEWQAQEQQDHRCTLAEQIMAEGLPATIVAAPPLPLAYLSKHPSVAWEIPRPDGTVSFALRIDSGKRDSKAKSGKSSAASKPVVEALDSPDEW